MSIVMMMLLFQNREDDILIELCDDDDDDCISFESLHFFRPLVRWINFRPAASLEIGRNAVQLRLFGWWMQ